MNDKNLTLIIMCFISVLLIISGLFNELFIKNKRQYTELLLSHLIEALNLE